MTDLFVPSAPPGHILELWVVYANPSDYPPGTFVVRRQWTMQGGQIYAEYRPRAVTRDLESARAIIPEHLTRMDRMPGDVPAIIETWI